MSSPVTSTATSTETSTDQHEYEVVFIAQPNLDSDGMKDLYERLATVIANFGGEVTGTDVWGRRNLAYPIKRFFEGQYVLQRCKMAPAGAHELERALRLNENVIRYLIMRTDD